MMLRRPTIGLAAAFCLVAGAIIAQPARAQTAPATPPLSNAKTSMGEIFFMQRHPTTHQMEWFGSMIIWSLITLSAASVGLMGARLWENRSEMILPQPLLGRAQSLLKDGRVSEFLDFLRLDRSDFASLLTLGLSRRGQPIETVQAAMEDASDAMVARRMRRLEPLNIIGNVAPMIGLFGTVYGMILVFRAIVAAGGTPDPTNLAAGIGTKLVGTFWGLIVAIPALSAYAFLRNRVEGSSAEALVQAKRLLDEASPAPSEGTPR
ncbi:MAG: MotA/TolQ/ExbB proton channel family protein [Phycisphaerae bacterium]|nr:MotA/TolQ/ExbB proton channel family protein [Phycisphaerae bacterium]